MQRELRTLDVTLAVVTASTMAHKLEWSQAAPKAVATFLGALGGLGLVLYRPNIDPIALLAIAGVTAMVGVAAASVPARRAVRMHPLVALRHE